MADILRWQTVRTRKSHRCWGFRKKYPTGTAMTHAAYADRGSVYDCYWCPTCEEYMQRYFSSGDEVGAGEIYENDPDGWDALKAEIEKEAPNE